MNAETILSPLSAALSNFSSIMGKLREVIAFHTNSPLMLRSTTPLMQSTLAEFAWRRLRRAEVRFLALAACFRAGKFRPSKPNLAPRRAAPARPDTPGPDAVCHGANPKTPIPRRFGWLLNHVRHTGVAYAHRLRLLLAEPEMRELLAASPRARRILAPSCHMLGVEKQLLTPTPSPPDRMHPAVATIPHAEPPTEPPPPQIPGVVPPAHLRILWRPQSDP